MIAYQIFRVIAVMALLIVAAVLATAKGTLPLALRGVYKIMRRDAGLALGASEVRPVPLWKRLLAFAMVLAAVALALI